MTNYTWLICSLSSYTTIDGESDVVFEVSWQCSAFDIDGGYRAVSNGSVPVDYTAGSPFTPYDQLTQEQVWGWINPSINRPEIEANLQALIDAQINPPVVTPPLPWSN